MAVLTGLGTRALGAVAIAALLAACYQPTLQDCTVSCSGADDCAGDQICGPDGFCSLPEVAGSCGDAGAVRDAEVARPDADPSAPDADVSQPDAGNLDAALPPDAAGPPVLLKVRIVGVGRVVSEAYDISCDDMCDYQLPMGSVVTMTPVVTDQSWHYKDWTAACTGQTPDCTLTLSAAQQTARARFEQ